MATLVGVYENDSCETISKIETVNGTVLIESFINSNDDMEYSIYGCDDGGVLELDQTDSVEELNELYKTSLKSFIETEFKVN